MFSLHMFSPCLFLSTLQCCATIFMNVHIGLTGNPIALAQVFMEGAGDIPIHSHVGTCRVVHMWEGQDRH